MIKYFRRFILVSVIFIVFGSAEVKADTNSTGYIDSSGTSSSPSGAPTVSSSVGSIQSTSPDPSSSDTTSDSSSTNSSQPISSFIIQKAAVASSKPTTSSASSNSAVTTSASTATSTDSSYISSAKSTTAKLTTATTSSNVATPLDVTSGGASSAGVSTNVQSASVQVEPSSGSASLSIPIAVPAGRAGIQPNLALSYNSSLRQLGNAGVGWNLDLGSIQISTKKGVPKYDGTDIFTMEQNGSMQDLVADPSTPGLYHMEVEGAFANIQYFTDHWMITDKKGIKYYYGNTSDSKQGDPANPMHIFRWALNRVEDLNGNYMVISYLNDNGQIYPQTISYTGNDTASLILSTYAQVNISYVAASSPSISYISKFLVKTAQRIDHIAVSVGPNVQSTYTFVYHQSANNQRDLLQSVQQTGSDGATQLPPVTFTYNETLPQWQLASGWTMPSDLTLNMNIQTYSGVQAVDAGIRAVDLNGDGYPDFIRSYYTWNVPSAATSQAYTYLNTKNNGWSLNGGWSLDPQSTPFNYYVNMNDSAGLAKYNWSLLADLNGDGLMDLFTSAGMLNGSSQLTTQGSVVEANNSNGTFTEYRNNLPIGTTTSSTWNFPIIFYATMFNGNCLINCPQYSFGAQVGDVDGDGFPDLVQSMGTSSSYHGVYINQYPQGTQSFTLNSSFNVPANTYTDFTQGATLVDLAGDGLSDIFYLKGGVAKAYLNNGSGWVETGDYENTFGLGDLIDQSTQLVDVNGDGLPDLVITTNGDKVDATILLNTGSGWKLWLRGGMQNVSFFDYATQFLDANADGMQGYLTYETGGSPELYLNANKPVDLLIGINNGIGASTSIQYDSDFHYQNTYMPYFMPVVKSTTTTVGSQNYTTSYSYAGGLWDKVYREFDGFQAVTITDPQGNYVTSTFLQDHWLKGHPSEQDTYDSNGNLYSKSVNQWQTQTIVTNNTSNQISKFLFVSRTDNYLYDGNSSVTPKRTAQEFTYAENPQYGDVTQMINDGQVDPAAGTSIDANKTTTNISYVNNTNNWLLGLPAQTITQDVNGNTISKTSFFYDGDTTGSATPSLGRLTAKVNWLGSTTQADPKTTYTYDAYGNLQTTTDPNGDTTTITYDSTVHMFPVKTSNALSQPVTMTYYGVDAAPLNDNQGLQGLWGQDRSKTDANNQTAYTTYDALGRPLTSISPLDSIALPTEQKSYNIQSNYIAVTDTARVDNGSSATINTVSYYDGLDRLIETKSLGPTAGQYIASDLTVYDNRGLPVTKYLPHFTSNNLNTLDSIDTTVPSSQVTYDPMGRVITKINPDSTYSSISYNQWTTTSTDENGHMQQSFVDAFGRLIQKEEYLGSDGRSPNYPSAPYTLYATTSYSYDPKGDLTSVMDTKNNVTSITYDNLGRKIGMNDPDMGVWHYGYDGNSNLIWQQDAKNQVISFKYDALNRLINKTDAISGPIVNLSNLPAQLPTFNVNYNFDDPSQSFGIGRLGSVSYDTGTAKFVYDQLGREVTSNKTVDLGPYNVTRQYDALDRLKQLQYPDGSQVSYVYNQAGQIAGVADAGAVINGVINPLALESKTNNEHLAWYDKALGINNAYAATTSPIVAISTPANHSTIAAGSNLNITVIASEKGGTITHISLYNGAKLLGSGYVSLYNYVISNAPVGSYTLIAKATDAVGVSTTSTPVTVTVVVPTAPKITTQPANMTVITPATAVFSVTASGMPAPSYQWMQSVNGGAFTNIKGATGSSYTTAATIAVNNGTQYECIVSNMAGSVTSNPVTLKVNAPPTVLIKSPANNSTFFPGSNIPIIATASEANGSITNISLYENGTKLLGTSNVSPYGYVLNNAPGGTYTLTAKATDANGVTTTSSPVTITVAIPIPPRILTQPANMTVTAPATAAFSVMVMGTPAPSYQWMQSINAGAFTMIKGATSSYYSMSASTAYNGAQYKCVITNSMGSVTSNAATLTVNEPVPTVSLTANSSNYAAPATVILTAIASETGGKISKVEFYNGPSLLGSSTSSPYTYTWNNVAAGNYNITAEAYDNNGDTSTSKAINVNVTVPNVYVQSINYNANGQITQIQYGNGTVTAYTYDPLSFHLMRIYTSNAQAQVVQDLNYTYDSVGQVLSIKDNVNTATQSFYYDALNRLTSAQGYVSYGPKFYEYDQIGNILMKDAIIYHYGDLNSRTDGGVAGPHAVTSLSDGTTLKYDLNGNMVSMQKGSNLTQYVYDSQNRLQNVTVGGLKVADYAYDGDGGRTQKTVYRRDLALYNDNVNTMLFGSITNPLPATAQNPTIDTTLYVGNVYEEEGTRHTKFIYLGSTRVAAVGSDGNVFYYHTDHLGGTNVLTDNTGVVRELTEYDPFGQVCTHDKYGNDFATAWYYFTGKPLDDETGLIFLGSRYYNPVLGRFITPDTEVQAPQNPQTLNRYTYCNNNPVNLVDPTGHSWFSKLFKAIGDFFSNLVKNPLQTIINIATIVIGVVTVNPVLVASGEIGLFNEGTSSFKGGAWNTIHQVLGYAQIGLAVVGGLQAISSAFSQASGEGLEAGDGDVLEPGTDDAASTSNVASLASGGTAAETPNDLTSVINSDSSSVIQQASATNQLVSSANNAGGALSNVIRTTVIGPTQGAGNQFLNWAFGNTYAWKAAEVGTQFILKASLTVVSVATGGVAPTLFAFGSDMIGEADWNLAIYAQSAASGQSIEQVAESAGDARDIYDNVGSATDLSSSSF